MKKIYIWSLIGMLIVISGVANAQKVFTGESKLVLLHN